VIDSYVKNLFQNKGGKKKELGKKKREKRGKREKY